KPHTRAAWRDDAPHRTEEAAWPRPTSTGASFAGNSTRHARRWSATNGTRTSPPGTRARPVRWQAANRARGRQTGLAAWRRHEDSAAAPVRPVQPLPAQRDLDARLPVLPGHPAGVRRSSPGPALRAVRLARAGRLRRRACLSGGRLADATVPHDPLARTSVMARHLADRASARPAAASGSVAFAPRPSRATPGGTGNPFPPLSR